MDDDEKSVLFLMNRSDIYMSSPVKEEPDAVTVFLSDDMAAQDVVEEVLHNISLV